MAAIGAYPSSLQYVVNRIVGYSKQSVKVQPSTPVNALPGDTVIFTLPPNSMVDLSSVTFKGELVGITGADLPAIFPRYSHCFVEMMDTQINNTSIDGANMQYHRLYRILADYHLGSTANKKYPLELGGYSGLGGSGPTNAVPLIDFYSGTAARAGALTAITPNTDPNATLTGLPWFLQGFPGFLGCGKVIDTSLTGEIRILIRLAPNTILASTAANTTMTYTMHNLSMLCDIWSVDDGVLYGLLQSRLATQPITIPFHRWVSFSGPSFNSTTSVRWALSTQSLDLVLATFARTTYTNRTVSAAFNGPVPFFKHDASGIGGLSWTHNSVSYPAYTQDLNEAWHQLLNTLSAHDEPINVSNGLTAMNWWTDYFATGFRFCLPDEPGKPPFVPGTMSGIDTRGLQSSGTLEVLASTKSNTLASNALVPFIWARCHAHLLVGSYRTSSLLQ